MKKIIKIPIRLPDKSVRNGPEIKKKGKKINKYLLKFIIKLCFIKNLYIYEFVDVTYI